MTATQYNALTRKEARARDTEIRETLNTNWPAYVDEWEDYFMLDNLGRVVEGGTAKGCLEAAHEANELYARNARSLATN